MHPINPKIEEKIEEIKKEITHTQKNKATEKHLGLLTGKIAKLRCELEKRASKKLDSEGFMLKKAGDATVCFVGFPSVGKSSLLNELTNANSKVGDYDFTTLLAIPGMMKYNGAQIQLIDLPGIIVDASTGKGKGKKVLSALHNANLILILLDKISQLQQIQKELYNVGVRINEKAPPIFFFKKASKGVNILTDKSFPVERAKEFLRSQGWYNGDVLICGLVSFDQFTDVFSRNKVYVPSIVVFNKDDLLSDKEKSKIKAEIQEIVFISTKNKQGLDNLKQKIFEKLELKRLLLKKPNSEIDFENPLIFQGRTNVFDVCEQIRRGFKEEDIRFARIFRKDSRYNGQKIGLDFEIFDKDVLELHFRY